MGEGEEGKLGEEEKEDRGWRGQRGMGRGEMGSCRGEGIDLGEGKEEREEKERYKGRRAVEGEEEWGDERRFS